MFKPIVTAATNTIGRHGALVMRPSGLAVVSKRHATTLTPAVARLVTDNHLMDKLSKIRGTGPKGRLLKGDILMYLGLITPRDPPKPTGVQGPPPGKADMPKRGGSQWIADRLAKAKRDRLVQRQCQVTIDQVNRLIQQLNRKQGLKLSLDDFILRAAAMALKQTSNSATTVEVATPTMNAPIPVQSQAKLMAIERANNSDNAPKSVKIDPNHPPRSLAATTTTTTAATATTSPRSNLLDYLLDTTGTVAAPSIKQEFPHNEQQITLTMVASSTLKADAAHQLLNQIVRYLEQPQLLVK
ncbi:hypothetical protein BDF19DRAFT_441722 [Syncephalis fuscata]|nr:hypothetical protein BDF19DRAFT_441722 [Syncephalis fuscata]